jgi:CheY-like chemotaxis protein
MTDIQESKTILIIEDSKFFSSMHSKTLTNLGYTVYAAADGDEGLKLVAEYKPNLILLDLIMPGKDGFDVLKELQKDEELSSIPVLVMSELVQDEDVNRATKLGAKGYLKKSDVSSEDILKKIQEFV